MKLIQNNQVNENLILMERYAVSAGKYLSNLEGSTVVQSVGNSTPM